MGRTKLDPSDISVKNDQENPLNVQTSFDSIMGTVPPGTAKLTGEDWFDGGDVFDAIPPKKGASCRVEFIFTGNDARVFFSWDSLNYGALYEETVLKAGGVYSIITSVEEGNNFNIKADADVTIEKCIMSVIGKQDNNSSS